MIFSDFNKTRCLLFIWLPWK